MSRRLRKRFGRGRLKITKGGWQKSDGSGFNVIKLTPWEQFWRMLAHIGQ